MMRAGAVLLVLLGACAGEGEDPRQSPAGAAAALPAPAQGETAGAAPALPDPGAAPRREARPAADAPRIYMDIRAVEGGGHVLTFATDASRDATPSDDPAVRIAPRDGACNAEELPAHRFPPDARPVFGPDQVARGLGPAELPAFMAVAATEAMLARGLAPTREATRPENICTRKLWERLVARRTGQ